VRENQVPEQCPVTSETLSAFVDGELPIEQRCELARHIITCQRCSRQIGTIYSLKVLVSGPDQQPVQVPRDFWKRAHRRLDEIDAVARQVVSISPGRAPAWRLATLAAAGLLLIILAVGIRGAIISHPKGWTHLAAAHRTATTQLLPPVAIRPPSDRSGQATQAVWQPTHTQAIHTQMCSGRQVIYSRPGALISYFVLPCNSLEVSGLTSTYQGGLRFYLTASDELSIIAWRQGPGWGILVGATSTEQLLEIAQLFGKPNELRPGF
jgi:anti-sigma factor RsiW